MNVYTVRGELEKAGITVRAVVESGDRSVEDDEVRISDWLRVQVADDGSYCALVEERLNGTFIHPYRTRVKDLVEDVSSLGGIEGAL